MTKKLKMSLLGMSSVAVMAAPVALAVSCGSEADSNGVINVAAFTDRAAVGDSQVATNGAYKAQLVLDGHDHSVNDNSFNQAAFAAVSALSTPIQGTNVTISKADNNGYSAPAAPSGKDQFISAYSAVPENSIMVLPGFMHIDPLNEYKASLANKKQYAILLDGDVTDPRVASVNFQAHQAAFEAGVLAGAYLNANKARFGEELKVATFGGMNIPTVTGSMAGFQKGIEYFNEHNSSEMTDIIFMDNGSKADYFSGGFAPGMAKPIADKLVSDGADLIFPVAGPQANDVKGSIVAKKSKAQIIGVDTAQETDKTFDVTEDGKTVSLVAFSALKNLTKAATDIMGVIAGNTIEGVSGLGHQTLGTLDNGLVGVSQPTWIPQDMYEFATAEVVKTAAESMTLEFKY